MVQPREEQLGAITLLDKDSSGFVNCSSALIQDFSGVMGNAQSSRPGNASPDKGIFWVEDPGGGDPTVAKFTNSNNVSVDLKPQSLSEVLNIGNTTGGHNLIMSSGDSITSSGVFVNVNDELVIQESLTIYGELFLWQTTLPSTSNTAFYWDTAYNCPVIKDSNSFFRKLGQDNDLIVYNDDIVTITAGKIVNITDGAGAIYDNVKVKLADNTTPSLSNFVLGIALEDINVGNSGKVVCFGKAYGMNTNSFTVGDILYLGTSGNPINVQPTSGQIIPIGIVDYVGTINGAITVVIGSDLLLSGDVNGTLNDNQVDSLANGGITVSQSPLGASSWGLWPSTVTPSTYNYCLYINSSEAKLNASTTVRLSIGNVAAVTATSSGVSLASAGSTATRFEANSINTSYVPINFPESTIPSTPSDGNTIFSTEDLTVKSAEGFVKTICPAGESGSQEVSIVKSIDGYGSHTTSFDIEGELFALNFSGFDFATVKVKCELYGGADGLDPYYQERIALLSRVSGSWVLNSQTDKIYIEGSGTSFEPMDFSLSGTDNKIFYITFFGDTAGLYQIIIKINGRE